MSNFDTAKQQAIRAIRRTARSRETISYSKLAGQITALNLDANSPELYKMLDELSTDEANAGRGMLSAVVVHKTGDLLPGPGFFDLARRLGRPISARPDEDERRTFHAAELERVWKANTM